MYANYQLKITYFIHFIFLLILLVLFTSTYLTSREIYDYYIVLYNFLY